MIDRLLTFNPIAGVLIFSVIALLAGIAGGFFIGRLYQRHREPVTIKELKNKIEVLNGYREKYYTARASIKGALIALSGIGYSDD